MGTHTIHAERKFRKVYKCNRILGAVCWKAIIFFVLLLTAVALRVNHGNVIEFGLFDTLYGSWAPRQGAMCQERAVNMASAITAGRRAINTIEFHSCSGGNSCFMLLNGSPIF